jgi:hypothetical protein
VSGDCDEAPLVMGGEDFAFMLEERPGAYILVGNGDTAPVHHPKYNFNDEAIPAGCSWWAEIVERRLPAVIVAPEARGPACEAERVFGTMAPRRLAELLPVGTEVRITDLRADTFAGRVVAEAERLVDTNCRCLRIELLALRVAPVGAVDALRRRAAGH